MREGGESVARRSGVLCTDKSEDGSTVSEDGSTVGSGVGGAGAAVGRGLLQSSDLRALTHMDSQGNCMTCRSGR